MVPKWKDTPAIAGSASHSFNGGIRWRHDSRGVFIGSATKPERTPGDPKTCIKIAKLFERELIDASMEFGVPPELLVMTIATEAAAYKEVGFTGRATFRWEAHVVVKDAGPEFKGDYSLGPMQTLATTARW